jgi:hypothetical protein
MAKPAGAPRRAKKDNSWLVFWAVVAIALVFAFNGAKKDAAFEQEVRQLILNGRGGE